jgi:hypothetical protein
LADAAADVRLVAEELADWPRTSHLRDILLSVADNRDGLAEPEPPVAA